VLVGGNERILGNKVEKSEKLTLLRVFVVVAADGGGKTPAFVVSLSFWTSRFFKTLKIRVESESQQAICSQPAGWSRHTIGFCVHNEIQKLTNRNTSFPIPQSGFAGQ